jgi:hypothetical protein
LSLQKAHRLSKRFFDARLFCLLPFGCGVHMGSIGAVVEPPAAEIIRRSGPVRYSAAG